MYVVPLYKVPYNAIIGQKVDSKMNSTEDTVMLYRQGEETQWLSFSNWVGKLSLRRDLKVGVLSALNQSTWLNLLKLVNRLIVSSVDKTK